MTLSLFDSDGGLCKSRLQKWRQAFSTESEGFKKIVTVSLVSTYRIYVVYHTITMEDEYNIKRGRLRRREHLAEGLVVVNTVPYLTLITSGNEIT
ncbi:hypothetical protein M378DRAFT_798260 [Amanita muscaria Koide BX008]|uniref:Uncharacterized protein n=1 Tax=Amanita muscaria (strain Koide BX008) TaxID=946122 RepID=A0A0C2T6L8_AMAMK|nr:hypothetical protein M378DRAFT_798260 [Amanita muscaria Koide BX008]